jgi:hypothetical protein
MAYPPDPTNEDPITSMHPPGSGSGPRTDTLEGARRLQILVAELECTEALTDLIKVARDWETARQTYQLAERSYRDLASRMSELRLVPETKYDIRKRMMRLRLALFDFSTRFEPVTKQARELQ